MNLRRRNFLKLGLTQAAVIGLPKFAFADGNVVGPMRRAEPSILQGATDDSRTQFSIMHDAKQNFEFQVTNASGRTWQPDQVTVAKRGTHPKVVTQVQFSDLYPNEIFHINLIDASTKALVDQREFKTLDIAGSSVRFAICSCMKDTYHEPTIWRDLIDQSPDVIFFIGDSVYADSEFLLGGEATPEMLWRRFCEARATLEIYFSKRLIPVFATWDDHDFGGNDVTGSYPYSKLSLENYQTLFAQDVSHCQLLDKGPGVSNAFRFKEHLFVLLDDRTYREARGSEARYAHWGQEQEEWMMKWIENHNGPIWLMNGSQFFPSVRWKESVSGDHPHQFAEFKKELTRRGKKVFFASGDVHYSEISRIEPEALGYETFEITSSSIHSPCIPGFPGLVPNDRRIQSTANRNYILVESTATGSSSKAAVKSCSANKAINFAMNLSV